MYAKAKRNLDENIYDAFTLEEAKRLHFETQAPGGQPVTRDASYSYDKDSKVLTITGDDGTQQAMTKID